MYVHIGMCVDRPLCHEPESDFRLPKFYMLPWDAQVNTSVEVESRVSSKLFSLPSGTTLFFLFIVILRPPITFSNVGGANTKAADD